MVTLCLYGSFVFDGGSSPHYCKFAVAAHVYASFEGFACLLSFGLHDVACAWSPSSGSLGSWFYNLSGVQTMSLFHLGVNTINNTVIDNI
jgi:hypothetical protein